MMWSLFALILGFFLDLLVGDPHGFPHPVVLIGKMISGGEKLVRKIFPKTVLGEQIAGGVLWVLVVGLSFAIPALLLSLAYGVNQWLGFALETLLCAQILATKSLKEESMKVYAALKTGDLEASRYAVSMIVGRDVSRLDEAGVTRAAVETVAENTSDGVIAPMVFLALLGPAGGYFYKAVNTMDSMIGYRNEVYERFGKTAARLDDLVNLIPARLTGFLFCLTAGLLPGFDGRGALRIFFRDRKKHASPNSAHGEAACAGALGLRLAGDAWYFGKLHHKPWIGDETRPIEAADIGRACRLMTGAQLLLLAGWGLMLWVL